MHLHKSFISARTAKTFLQVISIVYALAGLALIACMVVRYLRCRENYTFELMYAVGYSGIFLAPLLLHLAYRVWFSLSPLVVRFSMLIWWIVIGVSIEIWLTHWPALGMVLLPVLVVLFYVIYRVTAKYLARVIFLKPPPPPEENSP